jgi:2-dehydropantoate 2-reductase
MKLDMNIGVIGVGGVGGYFGGKLCRLISTNRVQVHFIARGRHLDAIRRDGLFVHTAEEGDWVCRPTSATDDFDALPPLDFCLVCVKGYDLQDIARRLRQCVSGGTAVVPLLNGIDIYERLRAELNTARIYPACTYIGVHIVALGKIAQRGGDCRILLGKDPQEAETVPRFLFELFDSSGIGYEWQDNISSVLWRKYLFIVPFGIVQACFDKTLGQVMETPSLSAHVQALMEEIAQLAAKMGVPLPADIVVSSYEKGRNFSYKTKTSFQRDFETAGKPDERELFSGTILRLGKQLGVPTPAARELHDLMERRKPLRPSHGAPGTQPSIAN